MLAVHAGRVLTMEGPELRNATILVREGKIEEVQEGHVLPDGYERLDATDAWVMPGSIDSHTHIGAHEENVGAIGADYNEAVEPLTPYLRVIDGVYPEDIAFEEARRAGVTAVCVCPGSANVIGGQVTVFKVRGERVDDMVLRDVAGLKAALGENPKRVYGDQRKSPMTRMATAALLRKAFFETGQYLAKIEKDESEDRDMGKEVLARVLRREIPLRAHAHRADDIMTALRVAREFDLDIVIEHCTEGHKVAEELREAGVPAILGPTLMSRGKVEVRERTFRTASVLHEAGVKFALMTDHPIIPEEHLRLCCCLAAKHGLPRDAALRSITIEAAEIIGVSDRVGSIAPGKDADLVVFDRDPIDPMAEVRRTYIDGECVYSSED